MLAAATAATIVDVAKAFEGFPVPAFDSTATVADVSNASKAKGLPVHKGAASASDAVGPLHVSTYTKCWKQGTPYCFVKGQNYC